MLNSQGAAGWYFSLLCLGLSLQGCAFHSPPLPAEWTQLQKAQLTDTAFFPQKKYQCGPASLASVLQQSGVTITPDTLSRQIYLPERHGSLQLELIGATRRNDRIPYRLQPNLSAIARELQQHRPVLILQNLGLRSIPAWHYAVVIGIDPALSTITLHSGTTKNLSMDAGKFLRSWDLAERWGIVALRPGELPADNNPAAFLKAVAAYSTVTNDDTVVKSYANAVKRWPQNHLAWFSYAANAQVSGNHSLAIRNYLQALRIKPDHLPSINNLSLMYAETGKFDQALKLLDEGLLLYPDHDFINRLKATQKEIIQMKHRAQYSEKN